MAVNINDESIDVPLSQDPLFIVNDSNSWNLSVFDTGLVEEDSPLAAQHQVLPVIGHNDMIVAQSPTCQLPCTEEWSGTYHFELLVDGLSSSKTTWLYSYQLNKIFVDVHQSIPIQFKAIRRLEEELLFVRTVAIYNAAQHLHIPVNRCPNHLKEDEDRGVENINHVVRCTDSNALYEFDDSSKRYSVVVPLVHPPAGSDVTTLMYSVTCKGSCAGGMNRRPVTLVFTLENYNREVVGRRTLNIRVCSCPKRDKKKEEAEYKESEGKNTKTEEGLQYPTDTKKIKIMKPKPQAPSGHEPLTKKKKDPFNNDSGESKVYDIQVTGTETYVKTLEHLILLKTYELSKTNSLEALRMVEEYKKMLKAELKGD